MVAGSDISTASDAGRSVLYQDIETVEVTAKVLAADTAAGTITSVSLDDLEVFAPTSLAETLVRVPSINIRTNSRGEVLASLRGSGERQLAIFWDGVPLNVPWDNRFDLRLIPALALDSMSVYTGPTAAGFGPNTAGGVIQVVTETATDTSLRFSAGSGDTYQAEAKTAIGTAATRSLVAGSYIRSDGRIAPGGTLSSFSVAGDGLITNTDREQSSFLAKTVYRHDTMQIGLSALYSSASFGIAPEQGPRIAVEDARFWRYPNTEHLLVSGSAVFPVSDLVSADARIWHQSFDQDIRSFTDASYQQIEAVQQDRNTSSGARVQLAATGESQAVTFSATGQWASHRQTDRDFSAAIVARDKFTHFIGSAAIDYSRRLSPAIRFQVGAGYDVMDPGETSGREGANRFDGVNISSELRYAPPGNWSFRFGAARKARLPTMRELFGEAIGRFLLNPDLEPETSWLFEAAAALSVEAGSFEIIPFWIETDDTLDQERMQVDGEILRKRINLPGSRVYGFEARAEVDLTSDFRLSGNATWSRSRAKPDSVANSTRRLYLSDRPNWLARLDAQYQVGAGTTFGLSVVHRGEARSEEANSGFLDLSPATKIDLSLRHPFHLARGGPRLELFAALNNLTDTFIEPQLGLPDEGRAFRLGLKTVF